MPIKVRVVHWHGVAQWKWKVDEEDCGICKQPFDATCPRCKMPGDECPPVFGQCNHFFHMHCVMKWLQQKDSCPLCRQPWQIKVNTEGAIQRFLAESADGTEDDNESAEEDDDMINVD